VKANAANRAVNLVDTFENNFNLTYSEPNGTLLIIFECYLLENSKDTFSGKTCVELMLPEIKSFNLNNVYILVSRTSL